MIYALHIKKQKCWHQLIMLHIISEETDVNSNGTTHIDHSYGSVQAKWVKWEK